MNSYTDSYDVVIVGAGSAGAVLAARLSEDPSRTVLLLEAGPDYGSDPTDQPADVTTAASLVAGHDWGHTGRLGGSGDGDEVPLFAGRLVGGGSAVNMAMALRGQPADYDGWAAAGNPGWSYADVLPFFRRCERDLDFGHDARYRDWHGTDGPVPVRRYRAEEFVPAQRAFLEAARARGHGEVEDHNAPHAVGAGRQPVNEVDGVRQSVALTYLRAARDRTNLTVRAGATVERIAFDGDGRAVGVVLAGSGDSGDRTVRAGQTVVAAGSYGSPALLQRSGIGPAEVLAATGVPVRHELPGVGANLHDHPLLRMTFRTAGEPVPLYHQAMLTCRSDPSGGPVDLQVFPSGPAAGPDGELAFTLLVALLRPYSRGHVRVTAADPAAPLDIEPGHLADPADLPRIVTGMELARDIAATAPLAGYLGGEAWPGERVTTPDQLGGAAAAGTNTYHHAVGTCRMGPTGDPGAVVDAVGRVHGVDGLRVVDASIMPTIPAANTNLPTLMVAERCAAALAAA